MWIQLLCINPRLCLPNIASNSPTRQFNWSASVNVPSDLLFLFQVTAISICIIKRGLLIVFCCYVFLFCFLSLIPFSLLTSFSIFTLQAKQVILPVLSVPSYLKYTPKFASPKGIKSEITSNTSKFDAVALLQSFRHFPCNEKSTRALHTTSLKCCLPATDAINRREKIHACALRFKVGSCKRAKLWSIRCSNKKKRSDTFLTDLVYPTIVWRSSCPFRSPRSLPVITRGLHLYVTQIPAETRRLLKIINYTSYWFHV